MRGCSIGKSERKDMRGRRITCMLGVLVLVSLAPVSSEAQRFDSGAPNDLRGLLEPTDSQTLPTTPWDDPDLQGIWNNSTTTPPRADDRGGEGAGQTCPTAGERGDRGDGSGLEGAGRCARARVSGHRPAGRANSRDAPRSDPTSGRARKRPRGTRRSRLVARPQQLGAVYQPHATGGDDPELLQQQPPDPADAPTMWSS